MTSNEHGEAPPTGGTEQTAELAEQAAAHAVATRLRGHLDQLEDVSNSELADHVSFYQRVHSELQGALTDIDDA